MLQNCTQFAGITCDSRNKRNTENSEEQHVNKPEFYAERFRDRHDPGKLTQHQRKDARAHGHREPVGGESFYIRHGNIVTTARRLTDEAAPMGP